MAEKIHCKTCGKAFTDDHALSMHTKAKHPETIPKERKPFPFKKLRNWAIAILVLALMVGGVYFIATLPDPFQDMPASQINIGDHQNAALHYHAELTILIDGEEQAIPTSVGVSPGVMRPVHTHDSTGEIHIEGPRPRDFTLGDFFEVWGKNFSSSCIFEYCTDMGSLRMRVNGQESTEFDAYVLRDHDTILIEYVSEG